MDEREAVAWLHRRAGWGLRPGELDELVELGVDAVLDRLVDPDGHGVPSVRDPWAGLDLVGMSEQGERTEGRRAIAVAWYAAMVATPRPLEERMRWYWHGHLVSSLDEVAHPGMMAQQLQLLGRRGLGDLPTLLREITVDPAMLRYLDGVSNHDGGVNENYGRELLELFALGLGSFTEADVRAASVALTGWVIDVPSLTSRFRPVRHDDTPQVLLGVPGVHDVDTVVAAVTSHPDCPVHVARRLAAGLLGEGIDPGLAVELGAVFRDAGLEVRALVRATLEAGLAGRGGALVLAPVPWTIQAVRALSLSAADLFDGFAASEQLAAAGQVPFYPPNVGGWPGGASWLSSSAAIARTNIATHLAHRCAPDHPLRRAAAVGDVVAVADGLARPNGFSETTVEAVRRLAEDDDTEGADPLAVALASPDMAIA